MLRWIRIILLFGLLFGLWNPPTTQAKVSTTSAPRLVVFEGFYNPG